MTDGPERQAITGNTWRKVKEFPINTLLQNSREAYSSGDFERCATLCQQALERSPHNPEALYLLGMVCHSQGKTGMAIEHIHKAVEQDPDNVDYIRGLAILLRTNGQPEQVIAMCRKALRLEPHSPDVLCTLGTALVDQGLLTEAEQAFTRSLALDPGNKECLNNFSVCLLRQGRNAEAASRLQPYLEQSGKATLYHNYGLLMRQLDRHKEAEQAQLTALRIDPECAPAWLYLVMLRRYPSVDHPDVNAIQQLLNKPGLPDHDREHLHMALGKCLEDCGQYAAAFLQYQAGNRITAKYLSYDAGNYDRQIESTTGIFNRRFILKHQLAPAGKPVPIFIVGLSRSGKSQLERLLARHPDVYRGGELYALPGLAIRGLINHWGRFPPERMETGPLQEAARRYQQYITRLAGDAGFAINTKPANVNYLGFVSLLFPEARIIHCRRDPLDTMVSMYFKHYGNAAHYPCRFESIRTRLRQHERLMSHWRRELPTPVLEVRYEELVTQPAVIARQVADHCGLDVSPALEEEWNNAGLDGRRIGRARHFRQQLKEAGITDAP